MIDISEKDYYAKHKDYRSVWTTERWDMPNWQELRKKYVGKRTMLYNDNGSTVLLVEGTDFRILDENGKVTKFTGKED